MESRQCSLRCGLWDTGTPATTVCTPLNTRLCNTEGRWLGMCNCRGSWPPHCHTALCFSWTFFSDCQTCCQSLFSVYRIIKSSGLVRGQERGRSIRTRWANASSKSVHFPSLISTLADLMKKAECMFCYLGHLCSLPGSVYSCLQLDHYTGCLVIMFHTG